MELILKFGYTCRFRQDKKETWGISLIWSLNRADYLLIKVGGDGWVLGEVSSFYNFSESLLGIVVMYLIITQYQIANIYIYSHINHTQIDSFYFPGQNFEQAIRTLYLYCYGRD